MTVFGNIVLLVTILLLTGTPIVFVLRRKARLKIRHSEPGIETLFVWVWLIIGSRIMTRLRPTQGEPVSFLVGVYAYLIGWYFSVLVLRWIWVRFDRQIRSSERSEE